MTCQKTKYYQIPVSQALATALTEGVGRVPDLAYAKWLRSRHRDVQEICGPMWQLQGYASRCLVGIHEGTKCPSSEVTEWSYAPEHSRSSSAYKFKTAFGITILAVLYRHGYRWGSYSVSLNDRDFVPINAYEYAPLWRWCQRCCAPYLEDAASADRVMESLKE
jgi:hypothetical protein